MRKRWCIQLCKPIEYITPRVNANVIYGLWVIMVCQYRFINGSRCPTLVGVLIMGRTRMCEAREYMEPSIPSSENLQLLFKKLSLKNSSPIWKRG